MNKQKIEEAIGAARAFICAGEELLAAERNAREFAKTVNYYVSSPVDGSKESGALRRKSMDLTRTLAEMRRP